MQELMEEIRELMKCEPTELNREKMRKLIQELNIRKTVSRVKRLCNQGSGGII